MVPRLHIYCVSVCVCNAYVCEGFALAMCRGQRRALGVLLYYCAYSPEKGLTLSLGYVGSQKFQKESCLYRRHGHLVFFFLLFVCFFLFLYPKDLVLSLPFSQFKNVISAVSAM